jgi:hypothetical protein
MFPVYCVFCLQYASWEESQKDFRRARSVWERAIDVDYTNVTFWLKVGGQGGGQGGGLVLWLTGIIAVADTAKRKTSCHHGGCAAASLPDAPPTVVFHPPEGTKVPLGWTTPWSSHIPPLALCGDGPYVSAAVIM